jgi:hypothetical protein
MRSSEQSSDGMVRLWDDHTDLSAAGEAAAAYLAVASMVVGKDSCCLYHRDEARDVVVSLLNIQQTYLFVVRYCLVPDSYECLGYAGSPWRDFHRTFTGARARKY